MKKKTPRYARRTKLLQTAYDWRTKNQRKAEHKKKVDGPLILPQR